MIVDTPSFHEVGHIQVVIIVRPQRSRFRTGRRHGRDVRRGRAGTTTAGEGCAPHERAGVGHASETSAGLGRLLLVAAGGLDARRAGRMPTVEAGRDHGDPDLVAQELVSLILTLAWKRDRL